MNIMMQNNKIKLIQVTKTVEWLVKNTSVNYFNPILFQGYQRKIDVNHCEKIVNYLKKDFYMPTSIICATEKKYNDQEKLRIVDGQHRVEAFRIMSEINKERYAEIKNCELSVIVIEEANETIEIDTFITINKTSKKVDTSLAYILRNKINQAKSSDDLNISKREYLAVELAQKINLSLENKLWYDKITFEGTTKNSLQLISLNAFVSSLRSLLYYLENYDIISLKWDNQNQIDACLSIVEEIFNYIWFIVSSKWQYLFTNNLEKRRIIQGPIGFSSINKFINLKLKSINKKMTLSEFKESFSQWINNCSVDSKMWEPGGNYSQFSSESGYNLIAKELFNKSE